MMTSPSSSPASNRRHQLTLVFDLSRMGGQSIFGGGVASVPELTVDRGASADIRWISCHLKHHLSLRDHTSYFLLLEAVCAPRGFASPAPSSSVSGPDRPYVIPLVCDQVWAVVLKSYQLKRLKIVVKKRPFVSAANFICRSLFPKRELKFFDMISYFPRILREEHLRRVAEDIFLGRFRIKPRLRKGVWPHLVRVFHPGMETREERESYLGKLRLIYDALKGRLQSPDDSPAHHNQQHLYDSIRRDAMRTDPTESFYNNGRRSNSTTPGDGSVNALSSLSIEASYLSRENIEKLVNITAVYTLEHEDVSYTQGMTDLLSPILYVMEREDDAYIVFSAMVQRIAENFGTWCEGTLKKVERLRHLCSVLDPELSAYLKDIEEDAFALFFGMVLIECRREFSFESSFHLMEVIWSAALCMRQREDPNWSPPSPTPTRRGHRNNRRIQAFSPEPPSLTSELTSLPSHSEWASFMSNRSPDVIRQVFGDLQTYTAVPLARSECGSIHSTFQVPHTTPPSLCHRPSLAGSMENDRIPEEQSGELDAAATRVISVEVHDRGSLEETSEVDRNAAKEKLEDGHHRGSESGVRGSEAVVVGDPSRHHQRWLEGEEDEEAGELGVTPNAATTERSRFAYSPPGKDRSLSDPIRCRINRQCSPGPSDEITDTDNGIEKRNYENSTKPIESRFISSERGGTAVHPSTTTDANQKLRRSCSASYLPPSPSPPTSPSPVNLVTRAQTEMSDMSSVGTNASGGVPTAGSEKGGLGNEEDEEEGEGEKGETWVEVATPLENGFHVPPTLDQKDEDFTILATDTPNHLATTNDSPSTHEGTDSTLREQSLTRDTEYPPVSPVRPFFDALEKIASLSRPNSPEPAGENSCPASSMAGFANFLTTENAVPAVSRESSLTVPFSDSFPLFICLAIIIQHRSRILRGNLDFVGLSVLLNTQAGAQNLDRTLRIARQLYERYCEYQRLCFGPRFSVYEVWLDNMESLFASPQSPRTPDPTPRSCGMRNGSLPQREPNVENV